MSPSEQNYDIYDKELLSNVLAFQDWRVYLEGSTHEVQVIYDHKNLEYFTTTKQLNRRQARWSEMLSAFHFVIQHRPGSMNQRADTLSRRADVIQDGIQDSRPLLKLAALEGCEPVWTDKFISDHIWMVMADDPMLQPILAYFQHGPDRAPTDVRRRFQDYVFKDGLLWFKNAIFVPNKEELYRQILRSRHDAPAAGHQGRSKTVDLVARNFYWPTLQKYVHRYVDGCDTCQWSKPSHHAPYGLLQPIPAAEAPWKRITTDFIVKLPNNSGYDAILVVVDKNTKLAHFVSTNETVD